MRESESDGDRKMLTSLSFLGIQRDLGIARRESWIPTRMVLEVERQEAARAENESQESNIYRYHLGEEYIVSILSECSDEWRHAAHLVETRDR